MDAGPRGGLEVPPCNRQRLREEGKAPRRRLAAIPLPLHLTLPVPLPRIPALVAVVNITLRNEVVTTLLNAVLTQTNGVYILTDRKGFKQSAKSIYQIIK